MLLLSLVMVSMVANFVAAADTASELPAWIGENRFYKAWLNGTFEGVTPEALKLLMLGLIVVLVYSALAQVKFPENAFIRILLAIIVGFLATFLLGTTEILSAMMSYSAMGMALIIFLPIMVLIFFTIVVASKGTPIGIFFQKLLWLAYALFLLLKAGSLLLLKWYVTKGGSAQTVITIIEEKAKDPKTGAEIAGQFAHPFLRFIIGTDTANLQSMATGSSNITLIILIIVAVGVLVIGVFGSNVVNAWLAKEKRDSEILAQQQMLERSHAYDKARSEMIQKE